MRWGPGWHIGSDWLQSPFLRNRVLACRVEDTAEVEGQERP